MSGEASAPEQVIIPSSEVIDQSEKIPIIDNPKKENITIDKEPMVDGVSSEATTAIPKLQDFLTQFNIPFDRLSQPLKDQYNLLINGQDEQGKEVDSLTYKHNLENFIDAVKNSQELGLKSEQQQGLESFKIFINSKDINLDQLVSGFKGYVDSSKALNIEQKTEANQVIDELRDAQKKGDEPLVKEKTGKLFNILKYVGIAILALLGISLFKSFSETGGTGR